MKTLILLAEPRGEKAVGTWLRDLGFKLIEVGAEVNIMRLSGNDAKQLLESRGMEVAYIVDGYGEIAGAGAHPVHRAGARRFPDEVPPGGVS